MAAQYGLCPYFIQSGCTRRVAEESNCQEARRARPVQPFPFGLGLAGAAATQDQGVRPAARLAVVAWTPADLDKIKSGIERPRRCVLACHFKDDRAEAVAL